MIHILVEIIFPVVKEIIYDFGEANCSKQISIVSK